MRAAREAWHPRAGAMPAQTDRRRIRISAGNCTRTTPDHRFGPNDEALFNNLLEDAILREMEQFLLELGAGFTFVARQKRLQIDDDDFYLDLLFYNRKLKRLVAIELKLGAFKAEYKSQMELYLRWLAKHEQEVDEQPPIGIILCAGKKQEQIELLELGKSGIHVAEYLTVLPPREALEAKLHQSIEVARSRLLDDRDGD
ncbi:hypothetical protein OKW32_000434 [Paraburkholderia youngii]